MGEMRRGADLLDMVFDADGQPVASIGCDCGTVTDITLEGVDQIQRQDGWGTREFAYTCDGCQTSHWLTLAIGKPEGGAP